MSGRFNLLGDLRPATRGLRALTQHLTGPKSPELKDGAVVLRSHLARVLNVAGHGRPSRPGQPPRRQTGRLHRSVEEGAVGDGRRIAATRYTALLLEPTRPFMARALRNAETEMRRAIVVQAEKRASRAAS